jgi:phosphate transport system protein
MQELRHMLDVKKHQIEDALDGLFQDVRSAIDGAIACLLQRNPEYCRSLIDNDVRLNDRRRLIEQDCLVAIASQQPVAHDLRDIVADMRIAAELERIGDYASDIAKSVLELDRAPLEALCLDDVLAMSTLCLGMLADAQQARKTGDAALARRLAATDDELDDRLRRVVSSTLATMRTDPLMVDNGSRMLWIAHNLERCGDRATNIAEQVVYRVEGVVEALD